MKLDLVKLVCNIIFFIAIGLIQGKDVIAQSSQEYFTYTYNGVNYTYAALNCNGTFGTCGNWNIVGQNVEDFLPLFTHALQNGGFATMVAHAGCANYLSIRIKYNCGARYCWGDDIYQESYDARTLNCNARRTYTCPYGCRDGECYTELPAVRCNVQATAIPGSPYYRIRWTADISPGSASNTGCVDEASCCPVRDPALPQSCRFSWILPDDGTLQGTGREYVYSLATAGNTYTRRLRFHYYNNVHEQTCSITLPIGQPTPTPTPRTTPSVFVGAKNILLIQ